MQKDMHFYGTYAIARSAGLTPEAANVIATCAQFVDDNVAGTTLEFESGARVASVATAHHAIDTENLDRDDQPRVWVPFHFIPGNQGDGFTERLKCRKNSPIAREMVEHHLSLASKPFGLELMGIAAHVYEDTFSHYGFSGVSSRGNKIDNDSIEFRELHPHMETYIRQKQAAFRNRRGAKLHPNFQRSVWGTSWLQRAKNTLVSWSSWLGENLSGALGHGAVATFPDRPYLNWSFIYERDDAQLAAERPDAAKLSERNNPETFFEGCEALHSMFRKFVQAAPQFDNGDAREFDSIRQAVADILLVQADMKGRIEAWCDAARQGKIFGDGTQTIPDYGGETWNDEWREYDMKGDSQIIAEKPVWHFYQAAAIHRTFVLRDLLPAHGLIVD